MSAVRSLPDDDMFEPVDAEQLKTAEEMDKWAGTRKPRRSKSITDRQMNTIAEEVERMMASGEWDGARGKHFVCAYERLYERVYGVAPSITPKERLWAAGLANKMLNDEAKFNGDPNEMASYIRWVWQREEGREKWRRDNGRSGGTIGHALLFNGKLFSEWRIDQMRHKG